MGKRRIIGVTGSNGRIGNYGKINYWSHMESQRNELQE